MAFASGSRGADADHAHGAILPETAARIYPVLIHHVTMIRVEIAGATVEATRIWIKHDGRTFELVADDNAERDDGRGRLGREEVGGQQQCQSVKPEPLG